MDCSPYATLAGGDSDGTPLAVALFAHIFTVEAIIAFCGYSPATSRRAYQAQFGLRLTPGTNGENTATGSGLDLCA
jgi:hypothetical protein